MSATSSTAMRRLLFGAAVLFGTTMSASPAHAAFHLWSLNELYTNSSGTLQFIELTTTFGNQQFVANQVINSSNVGASITNMLTLPTNLPGDSANRKFLIGTAGVQAAGGPAPDYIMPNGFLFAAGGSISYFGVGSGPYSALPTDGTMSRIWGGGNNAVNSPTNFAGQTGVVTVPEPTSLILTPLAVGMYGLYWRRFRRCASTELV